MADNIDGMMGRAAWTHWYWTELSITCEGFACLLYDVLVCQTLCVFEISGVAAVVAFQLFLVEALCVSRLLFKRITDAIVGAVKEKVESGSRLQACRSSWCLLSWVSLATQSNNRFMQLIKI